jgi:hypothetical protein
MSWSQRVFSMMGSSTTTARTALQTANANSATKVSPGLTGTYQWMPPKIEVPLLDPEYRGLEGEYDPNGLAKRVAKALDQSPEVNHLETLCILQQGSKISLLGKVSSPAVLNQVVELVSRVEGTTEVDVDQVAIAE